MRLNLAIILFAIPFPALAAEAPNCSPPSGVSTTLALAEFPVPIAHSLASHVPNLSPPGAPFTGSDAVEGNLNHRLIMAFHQGNRWVIAYEAGGRAYHHIVVAYDVAPDGKTSHVAFKSWSNSGTTCAMLTRGLTQNEITYPYW